MPTIYDVAQAAGVSTATVSRVFSGHEYVTAATRRKVLAAAEAIGYRPNTAARTLARGRSLALGLVLPWSISNPFYTRSIECVVQAARDRGYEVLITLTEASDSDSYVSALRSLQDRQADGMLVYSDAEATRRFLGERAGAGSPAVVVGSLVCHGVPGVRVDEHAGGHRATGHLLEKGHTAIAFVGLSQPHVRSEGRESGYVHAMQQAGLMPRVLHGSSSMEGGRTAVREAIDRWPGLTGIVAFNDDVALGVLKGCSEAGLRVPDDISVVGFDDLPLARMSSPALSSVRVPVEEMASRAVELLVRLIECPDRVSPEEHEVTLEPSFVCRDSTAPFGSDPSGRSPSASRQSRPGIAGPIDPSEY